MKLQTYDKLHIDVMVVDPVSGADQWRFTGFYGEARKENRYRSWELMQFLSVQSNAPWLCACDFNEILEASEQLGVGGRWGGRVAAGKTDGWLP